ncbi:MAG: CBS domain-containing protein, partial [Crocinitomicaceae bacterium]|nr:CBS domain-containing protein [Crocinitomicaceae bacterium]
AITREDTTTEQEQKILEGIVNFGNKDVKQIMSARTDTVALDDSVSFSSMMEVVLDAGYSRIPVYKDNFDQVVGILYTKDLLPYLNESAHFKWTKLIRAPYFVPENKKIDDLLKEFQEKKIHMAIVVDEYGGASGVVTLEDVLEEIVGEITDEFDDDDITYTKVDDNTYVFEGKTALVDLYKVLQIDGKNFEEAKGESDSIAGFMIEQSGKLLQFGQKVWFENYEFTVEVADKKRIRTVKVQIHKPENE